MQLATQKLKFGDQYTSTLPLFIEGANDAYTKPVYVLTSPQTGSAAEILSIATMAMDNAKRIGDRTAGALSTSLDKKLPNGWLFSISNEIGMDNTGKSYENIGIPVDYEIDYSEDRQTFFRNIIKDLVLDKQNILGAIDALREK